MASASTNQSTDKTERGVATRHITVPSLCVSSDGDFPTTITHINGNSHNSNTDSNSDSHHHHHKKHNNPARRRMGHYEVTRAHLELPTIPSPDATITNNDGANNNSDGRRSSTDRSPMSPTNLEGLNESNHDDRHHLPQASTQSHHHRHDSKHHQHQHQHQHHNHSLQQQNHHHQQHEHHHNQQRQQQLQQHVPVDSQEQHGSFLQNVLNTSSGFLRGGHRTTAADDVPPNPSLLTPPTHSPDELSLRKGSNFSVDSLSHSGRRRSSHHHRGGSISRLSDVLDEEAGDAVSLMSCALGAGQALKRARRAVWRTMQAVLVVRQESPKLVCEAELMEQVGWVCRDYVVARLVARDLWSRKTCVTAANWPASRHVISAGACLESLYPKVYSGLSRKLCLTMSSAKVVRTTLLLLLDVLFERSVSWAKIVSMMAVAGLYAEECVSQGHPDFVPEVVGVVLDFTGSHLLPWLVQQGGWDGFPVPESDEKSRFSVFRLVLVAGTVTTLALSNYYLDFI